MTPNSGTTIRADLNTHVEEASAADKFFIGHLVFPELPVDLKSGEYPRVKKGTGKLLKPGSTLRASKGAYGRVERTWETDNYACKDRGLEELVDDADRKDQKRFFNAEVVTAKLVKRAVRLDHEIRVAGALFNTGNFGAATAAVADYTVSNAATIDFAADILAAIERVNDNAEEANTIVLSPNVFNRARLSTKFQAFIRGSRNVSNDSVVNITAKDVAAAFADNGIENCYVGRARYDSAADGQAFAAARVWSDDYIWVGSVKGGDFMDAGAGRTIVWNEEGGLWVTESYYVDERRSEVIRVRQNTDEKVINGGAGTLIDTNFA